MKDDRKFDEFKEFKSKGSVQKKLIESKSVDRLFKGAATKADTFDCTPMKVGESDLEYLTLVGQGTFGKLFRAKLKRTGQVVAVKKVFQDPKYKNREVEIVSMLEGEFTMRVLGTFSTSEEGSQYLNIVMEYYDCDLYSHIKTAKKPLSTMEIKLLTYQAFRGLLYIHSLGICHRDIKPHNLLVKDSKLVICDFGSAKVLTSEPNLPYICSRCYRAPELIFGATHYSTMIDVWSLGCVILEMLHGVPLFIGESSIDHLIEIIKVMGTPTKTQVIEMNPDYDLNDYKFPKVKKRDWKQVLLHLPRSFPGPTLCCWTFSTK
jgi:serine/threonine protein kinase